MNKKYINFGKIILIFAATTLSFRIHSFDILVFGIVISAVAYIISPQKWSIRVRPLLTVAAMVILFQVIFNTELPFSTRVYEGIIAGTKIYFLSLLVFLFTATTSPSEISSLLSFLPEQLRLAVSITLGLIPQIMDESKKISAIQLCRGHKRSFVNPLNNILPVIIPLLHRTIKRAETISLIMESRGIE
jgi:energy-coupling factor transporter transmembrane protein EcfT